MSKINKLKIIKYFANSDVKKHKHPIAYLIYKAIIQNKINGL